MLQSNRRIYMNENKTDKTPLTEQDEAAIKSKLILHYQFEDFIFKLNLLFLLSATLVFPNTPAISILTAVSLYTKNVFKENQKQIDDLENTLSAHGKRPL